MQKADHIYHYAADFALETGGVLHGFQLKYTTLGQLNTAKDNVIWVCHALTGNSDVTTWWDEIFHDGSPLNPRDYFVICVNSLGGCYGSTGPLSINPATGKPFYHEFPAVTHRDIVGAFDLLREELGIRKVHTLMGGSLGGQQAIQ